MNRLGVGMLLLSLGLASGWVDAREHSKLQGERERIARERADVEARFTEQKAACQSRFAVADCLEAAKRERREALAPLRREAIALDDAERKERAARRLEALRSRAAAAPRQSGSEIVVRDDPSSGLVAPQAPPGASAPKATRAAREPRVARDVGVPRPGAIESPQARQQREAASQARIEKRRQDAQDHRDDVERRNAERVSRGKWPQPLPAPASAVSR